MPEIIKVRPYTLALVARYVLDDTIKHFPLYMKEFIDARSHPLNRSVERQRAMIEEEPALLPEAIYNVFLAGFAEAVAQSVGFEPPLWVEKPERFLPRPAIMGVSKVTKAYMVAETQGPFRRRNLFCGFVLLRNERWREKDYRTDDKT
ncbi:hypothetical protein [Hydrogenophilus thiooxidans]|uniref:hypothetical protein n=1 Tax=Hydrogenophilus thiooxidans TaxID=2820326 RepID=UPI001C2402C0|nr:hypothetical protein [Hydrogenophilus thiooxidans]